MTESRVNSKERTAASWRTGDPSPYGYCHPGDDDGDKWYKRTWNWKRPLLNWDISGMTLTLMMMGVNKPKCSFQLNDCNHDSK